MFYSYENQQVGRPLILADNTVVPMFEAKDDDGGEFGDITFEIANHGPGKFLYYMVWEKITCVRLMYELSFLINVKS